MHIQLDSPSAHSIVSYTDTQLTVHDVTYTNSLIISMDTIISPWEVSSLQTLTEESLTPVVQQHPEIILIGHSHLGEQLPMVLRQWLSQQRIGVEWMPIGAACRTFNILLSEGRRIVAGFIF